MANERLRDAPLDDSDQAREGMALPRLTRSVFWDLAIWMVGLGLLTGLAFPPMVLLLGVPADQVITAPFFLATVLAGLLVGGANFALSRAVVGRRLKVLTGRMRLIAGRIRLATETGDWSGCEADRCLIEVDSDDELGDNAIAFNGLVEDLERSHAVESAVHDLLAAISSHLDPRALAGAALGQILAHTRATAGAVVLLADTQPQLLASTNISGADAIVECEELRALMSAAAPSHTPVPAGLRRTGVAIPGTVDELLVLPVTFQDRALGAVMLVSSERMAAADERVLDLFTRAFGVALNNALTHQDSQRLARTDPLTGCANRRMGRDLLDDAFASAKASAAPLGLLMIDLDHFKTVNDRYGHNAGDAVLISASAAVRSCLRDDDALIRYGGEEFVAVLPGADAARLTEIAERVRAAIEAAAASADHEPVVVNVTASIGAAGLPSYTADSVEGLLEQADRALYEAKGSGRNRVVVAGAQGIAA